MSKSQTQTHENPVQGQLANAVAVATKDARAVRIKRAGEQVQNVIDNMVSELQGHRQRAAAVRKQLKAVNKAVDKFDRTGNTDDLAKFGIYV